MSNFDEMKSVKKFCDNRAIHGREGAVRDPNDKLGFKNKFIELILQQAIDDEVTIRKSDTVLDLGCGTGLFTEKIAIKSGITVGLDISEEMLKLATKNKPLDTTYCLYDGISVPFSSKSFDYIITREIFHLLSDDITGRIAGECSRILKTTGLMISTEFASANLKRQNGSLGRFERQPVNMIKIFEDNNLNCLRRYPIRRGRSLMQYLIRYGLYNENTLTKLAQRERKGLREKGNYTSSYNVDYLYIFQTKS